MNSKINSYINSYTNASPLAVFRIGFGLMMLYSILRFWNKGWIYTLYIEPKFHFKYYGFEWVRDLGDFTYILFVICIISSIFITIGYKYRFSMILFFLSFTYIELIDKTTYLNHYYFISILSFLMIFLPANAYFSVDNILRKKSYKEIPKWSIDCIKLLLSIVYFYSGLAKINTDWLLNAMPLKLWLPSKYDLPLIGETFMQQEWVHYFMSWGGMLYDLSIPFLLLYKKTRIIGFVLVIFFHLFTGVLFPIGMFPYIMIVGSLIFFDYTVHEKIIKWIQKIIEPIKKQFKIEENIKEEKIIIKNRKIVLSIISVFFVIQLFLPFRYLLYPSELFWSEEGYRFSWRVMLVEKIGYTTFKIKSKNGESYFYVNNEEFLTSFQEKQMSFQPDFILEYAHYLGDYYLSKGYGRVEVYAESYVSLNGRTNKRFINSEVDLYKEKESFKNKKWIIPIDDEIKGF